MHTNNKECINISNKKRKKSYFLEDLEVKIGEKVKLFLENKGKWKGPIKEKDFCY